MMFYLSFDNPISRGTPKYDGVQVAATPAITFKLGQTDPITKPTGTWTNLSASLLDLAPTADFQWDTPDYAVAAAGCDNTSASAPY